MKTPWVVVIGRGHNLHVYEGLCEVIRTLALLPADVMLICPSGDRTHFADLEAHGVSVHFVDDSGAFPRIPVSLRLLGASLRLYAKQRGKGLFMGADGLGNVVAALASQMTFTPYLHYSLELPTKRERPSSLLQRMEHWSCRRADLLVTMDEGHADFICRETGTRRERIALAPNTPSGPGQRRPSGALKQHVGLDPDAVLVLHSGGIGAAQASIPLADAARSWRPDLNLVFHAHCDMSHESYYQEFSRRIDGNPRVRLNGRSVAPDRLDELVSGADIGLAWYDRELLGYRADLLGLAAGKIGRCLRNGIPVVVRDLPSVRAYVEKYRCGICVESVEQIGSAIEKILSDREAYSRNALRCYEELWRPDRYLAEIGERVKRLLSGSK